ncbi:MAG: HAD-IC family P-type ATPase, partial [Candidatus Binataceae bacterium]
WLAAGLAFVAEWSDPGHGMAKVGYAILAVIVVSGLFSFWQEFRVERTLAALRGCFRSKSMCSSPLREQIAYLSRLIGILAVAIGLIFFAISRILGVPFWEDFIFAIGIIVAMVPEGLLPTLTLALVLATQRMAKRHVLIRYLPSVETLGSTTVICTDKTGTLTQNRMTVRRVWLGAGLECALNPGGGHEAEAFYRPFFMTASLCHDLREGDQQGAEGAAGRSDGNRAGRDGRAVPLRASGLQKTR